jgi:hypothetical protein
VAFSNFTESPFVSTIGEYLLAAQMLLLQSPQAIFILSLFLCHLGFLQLEVSLIENLLLLLSVHTFKVVRLDSMGS